MTVLSDYEIQVADLLHDDQNRIWSLAKLDRYINEARRQLVRDTSCLRSLQATFCTAGQEAYTFGQVTGAQVTAGGTGYASTPTVAFSGGGGSGVAATLSVSGGAVTAITFTTFGSGYTSAPTAVVAGGGGSGAVITPGVVSVKTFDVLDIQVTFGTLKPSLRWFPWSKFSAQIRALSSFQQRPAAWAVYGDNQFFLGPVPDQTYAMELDTIILPTDLTGATNDPIPDVAQDPIKFYAAYLAKKNEQSFGESEGFLRDYGKLMQEVSNAYVRRVPDHYAERP